MLFSMIAITQVYNVNMTGIVLDSLINRHHSNFIMQHFYDVILLNRLVTFRKMHQSYAIRKCVFGVCANKQDPYQTAKPYSLIRYFTIRLKAFFYSAQYFCNRRSNAQFYQGPRCPHVAQSYHIAC